MRFFATFSSICLLASVAFADQSTIPHIAVKIEEPAYAGLPIWLDVDIDDPCIAADYLGDLSGFGKGGRAEVRGPGSTKPDPGFKPFYYPHGSFAMRVGGCPTDAWLGRGGNSRIPLHIVANLRVPGHYAVRWVVPKTNKLGSIAPTEWLPFDVQPTTTAHHEAWLAGLLSSTPTDQDTIRLTYVPSLLAAWDDPRVTHRLLDLLCSPNYFVSSAVTDALGPALPEDGPVYLSNLIRRGCLSAGLDGYINRTIGFSFLGQMPDHQLDLIFQATISAMARAKGADLAHAIGIISRLKQRGGDSAKAADAAIFREVPRILAGTHHNGNSEDEPKDVLVEYFGGLDRTPGGREVLLAIAAQHNRAADNALGQLIFQRNVDDIPFLRERFMGSMEGFEGEDPTDDFEYFPKFYGAASDRLLLPLLQASTAQVRAAAAIELAREGKRAGMVAIIDTLKSDRVADRVETLNRLSEPDICQGEEGHRIITSDTDVNSPWVLARQTEAIECYEGKLKQIK